MLYGELKNLGITELKRIAKNVGIPVDDYKIYKSGTKDKLALLLSRKSVVKAMKNVPRSPTRKSRSPTRKSRSPTRKSRSPTRKVSGNKPCSPLTTSQCKNSSRHKKADIVKIAAKCGIEPGKKTRAELCAEIAKVLGKSQSSPSPRPSSPSPRPSSPSPRPSSPKTSTSFTKRDLVIMSVKKLHEIARNNKIAGYSKYKKADQKGELAELILKHLRKERRTSPSPRPNKEVEKLRERLSNVLSKDNLDTCEKKYSDKTSEELTKLRKESGHEAWGGKNEPTKAQNMEYLCSLDNNLTCNPLIGDNCEGDLVCDVTNDNNVCISEGLANERVENPKRGLQEMEWEGKRIIGSATAIKNLQIQLAQAYDEEILDYTPISPAERQEVDVDELTEQLGDIEISDYTPVSPAERQEVDVDELTEQLGDIEISDYTPVSPAERQEVDNISDEPHQDKPPPGTEVVDIEEVLRQVRQSSPDENIDDLTATQQAVLKCLGILA
jgi:hypothetical protein